MGAPPEENDFADQMIHEAEENDLQFDRELFGLERNVNAETPRRIVRPISRKALAH